MRLSVSLVNFLLGAAYVSIGALVAFDLIRSWSVRGFSHFGVAFCMIAFTCGSHHLVHGFHVGFEGHTASALDFTSVLVGLPFGAMFYALRVEAVFGGRGDRFVSGTPTYVSALPLLGVMYLTGLYFGLAGLMRDYIGVRWAMAPQLLLVVIYSTIGYVMLRTQIQNNRSLGGWSMSGGALTGIFLTCATMHLVLLVTAATGGEVLDLHTTLIDTVGVPAGLYFLWVVRGIYRNANRDWSRYLVEEDDAQLAGVGSDG
jgi:hypothetical protein